MPLTVKQKEYLLNCNHRWNVKTGATGSGKSYLDVMVTIPQRIIKSRGEGLIVLFGNTRGTLERNILEPMREIWTPQNVGAIRADNTVSLFGKKCYALGADNKKHVARIQGSTIEYAYGDEVTTWSPEVFQMLKSRLRCEHSHFDGTCNPDSPNHWFKQFLDSDADIYQQSYIIDDGVLPPYVVEELKKEYAGTIYYDRYILGLWALAEGLIYPMYQDAIVDSLPIGIDGEIIPASDYVLSIDYGTMNAFAALLWSKRGSVWYAEREYYYSGRDTGKPKTDQDYIEDLESWLADLIAEMSGKVVYNNPILGGNGQSGQRLRTIVDPSAASFITLLQKSRWAKVLPADNDVMDGIRETAVLLKFGIVKILSSLSAWKQEAGGYVWDNTDEVERPLKVNDHLMDSTRYFCKTMQLALKNRLLFGGGLKK